MSFANESLKQSDPELVSGLQDLFGRFGVEATVNVAMALQDSHKEMTIGTNPVTGRAVPGHVTEHLNLNRPSGEVPSARFNRQLGGGQPVGEDVRPPKPIIPDPNHRPQRGGGSIW